MRALLVSLAVGCGVLWAAPAEAQFQNHSIGVRVGFIYESPELELQPTFPIPAFGVNGSFYVENHFDVFGAIDVGIQQNEYKSQTLVIYPEVGLRYFLWEDYFRPYVGGHIDYIHTFFNNDDTGAPVSTPDVTDNLLGAGLMVGCEYSLTDQLAIGGLLEVVGLWWLNYPIYYEPRAFVRFSTNF